MTKRSAYADALVVICLAIVCAAPGIANSFVYDDVALIQDNTRIHDIGNWIEILTNAYWPPPYAPQLYRPVASLLMAVQYTIGLGSPMVFRVFSYALYAAATFALYRLSSKLLPRGWPLAVAALFAAHPVHVEALALGVNQGELIVALVALVMTHRYVTRRLGGGLSTGDWVALVILYAIAGLTKENGFVIPGLLVAAELTIVRGHKPALTCDAKEPSNRALAVGFGVLAMTAVALVLVRMTILRGSAAGAIPADALVGVGFGRRLLTMLQVVPTWLRLLAWPAHLQADYSPNEIVASVAFGIREAVGLLLVIVAPTIAWLERRRAPVVTFGVAWMAIALFPVSNLAVATGVVVAERTLFLPSIGFIVAVVALAEQLATGLGRRWSSTPRALATACTALVALGGARSMARELVWNNYQRLAAATARDAPRSLRVKQAHRDAVDALVADYRVRIAAAPRPWIQRNELAMLLHAIGEDSLAVEQLRLSLAQNAQQPSVSAELAALQRDSARRGTSR